MDELLSLFDDADSGGVSAGQVNKNETKITTQRDSHKNSTSTSQHDDFASSFGVAIGSSDANKNRSSKCSSNTNKSKGVNRNNKITTSCDPLTGLRIVDRKTSRADMVDAFSSYTYRPCSILAAASRSEWGTYIIDKGSSDNISGKTNLVTCGILTTDTSSRLSSKTGRAFAMLSLGDLPSSANSINSNITACVSVFLFGDALKILSNTKYIKAGYAVAILGPNLMPPRSNGNTNNNGGTTSITLSINDPKQVLMIGRAVDCDRCKGAMRVRTTSDYGGVKWEDNRCNTLVDLRCGGYCDKHRKGSTNSKSTSSSSSSQKNNRNTTFMQQQRAQTRQTSSDVWVGGQKKSSSLSGIGVRSSLSEALSQSGLLDPTPNSGLASKPKLLTRAPLHMKKQSSSSKQTNDTRKSMISSIVKAKNPYEISGQRKQSSTITKRKGVEDILGEALERKKIRTTINTNNKSSSLSSTNTKRPAKVFNPEGYEGSVQVPKPNAVLFKRGMMHSSSITPSPACYRASTSSILGQQKDLAALLKGKGVDVSTSSASKKQNTNAINKEIIARSKQKILASSSGSIKVVRPHQSSQTKKKLDDFASAFGNTSSSSSIIDRNAIMNAKSRFSSAIDAQEYARARAQVQELEAQEATKEGNQSSKQKKKPTVAIATSGWTCQTCKKTTPYKPQSCIRAKHDMRQRREIRGRETLSSRKDRLDSHGKDEDTGGLTLGSGLEWSGWRGGFS